MGWGCAAAEQSHGFAAGRQAVQSVHVIVLVFLVCALQALAPRALLLVRLLLAGVVGALPSARQQEITDVLYAILKVRRGGAWLGRRTVVAQGGLGGRC